MEIWMKYGCFMGCFMGKIHILQMFVGCKTCKTKKHGIKKLSWDIVIISPIKHISIFGPCSAAEISDARLQTYCWIPIQKSTWSPKRIVWRRSILDD